MTELLGVTNEQYIVMQEFEKYYLSRKNLGIEQMEKNQDLVVAKELFACWD
jgi:hypothetical protein